MKRVAVLRGGPSEEYAVSMRSGASVIETLARGAYVHKDIIITKQGEWLESGLVRTPDQALEAVDVVFLALHGAYGEDGKVQRLLERKQLPFTGSRSLASAIAFNKELTKNKLLSAGVSMPRHYTVSQADIPILSAVVREILLDLGPELFVKPIVGGSSIGARQVPQGAMLEAVLLELLQVYEQVMVEEYIRGKEATVGVLSDFRDQRLYALPAVEIIPPSEDPHFSYENKYNGLTNELVPGRFSYQEKTRLAEVALLVHEALDCKQYSRSDFIVRDGEVYFLEINTLPGLTDQSLLPKAAAAVGLSYHDLIHHLIDTATI